MSKFLSNVPNFKLQYKKKIVNKNISICKGQTIISQQTLPCGRCGGSRGSHFEHSLFRWLVQDSGLKFWLKQLPLDYFLPPDRNSSWLSCDCFLDIILQNLKQLFVVFLKVLINENFETHWIVLKGVPCITIDIMARWLLLTSVVLVARLFCRIAGKQTYFYPTVIFCVRNMG